MSYENCLIKATQRIRKGTLKLCPRGYCTAKHKFKVYPSAYANGYASQVCSGRKSDLEGNLKNDYENIERDTDSDLSRWYDEQWVNVCEKDSKGDYKPCGRREAKIDKNSYPYCRPLYKLQGTPVKSVGELSDSELEQMCKKKRSIEPGVDGAPTRVYVDSLRQKGGHYNSDMVLSDRYKTSHHSSKWKNYYTI